MKTKMGYSYDRISKFECPFRFRKLFIEKIDKKDRKIVKPVPGLIGKLAHLMLAKYLAVMYAQNEALRKDHKKERMWSPDALRNAARSAEGLMEWPEGVTDQQRQDAKDGMVQIYNLLLHAFGGWTMPGLVGIEASWIEKQLAFGEDWFLLEDHAWFDSTPGRVMFRAIIDWAWVEDGWLNVVDHKTGKRRNADELQLKIYALTGLYGLPSEDVKGVKVHFNMVRIPEIELVATYTRDEIEPFRDEIEAEMARIEENKKWDPVPNALCGWCEVQHICPQSEKAWTEAIDLDTTFAILNANDAARVLDLLLRVQARLDTLRGDLEKWVQTKGCVVSAGRIMDRRPKLTWSAKPGKETYQVLAALQKLGIEPVDAIANMGLSEEELEMILEGGAFGKEGPLVKYLPAFKDRFGKKEKTVVVDIFEEGR